MRTEVDAWSQFLQRYEWHYFCTFTFAEEYSERGARRAYERWYNGISQRGIRRTFMGIERGDKYGRIHLHTLIQFQPGSRLSIEYISKYWRSKYGRCRVEIPREGKAVSEYVSQYTSKSMIDYDYWERE